MDLPRMNEVLGVRAAAEALHMSPRTVLHWISADKIKATKTGPGTAGYVISADEIERIKAEREAAA